MKRILLFTTLLTAGALFAQSKATAVVTLTTGFTAKLELNNTTATATLTLTGPADRWFALQLGSFAQGQGMASGEDAVYWNGTTLVDATMTGVGGPPLEDEGTNDWTSTNTVSGNVRTVIATRAFDTGNDDDFAFNYNDANIDFAWARAFSATNDVFFHSNFRGYSMNTPFEEVMDADAFSLKNLSVYPNPVNDALTISYTEDITGVTLINMLGQTVVSQKVNADKAQIDTAGLQNGNYILKVTTARGAASIKIVK